MHDIQSFGCDLPSELCPIGGRAGRCADVRLGWQHRRNGRARVHGAGVGNASHVGDADGSWADEAQSQLPLPHMSPSSITQQPSGGDYSFPLGRGSRSRGS